MAKILEISWTKIPSVVELGMWVSPSCQIRTHKTRYWRSPFSEWYQFFEPAPAPHNPWGFRVARIHKKNNHKMWMREKGVRERRLLSCCKTTRETTAMLRDYEGDRYRAARLRAVWRRSVSARKRNPREEWLVAPVEELWRHRRGDLLQVVDCARRGVCMVEVLSK